MAEVPCEVRTAACSCVVRSWRQGALFSPFALPGCGAVAAGFALWTIARAHARMTDSPTTWLVMVSGATSWLPLCVLAGLRITAARAWSFWPVMLAILVPLGCSALVASQSLRVCSQSLSEATGIAASRIVLGDCW